MDNKNPEDKEKQAVNKQKSAVKPYTPPKLKEFGSLTELTAAGTGATYENTPGQGPTTKRP